MATYASIKYDMDLASSATGAGAMILLATETASSSATISFTSGIDSTYKEYIFKFIDIHPASNNEKFSFQVDTGTNTNYNITCTSATFRAYHKEDGTEAGLGYQTGQDQAQGTSFQEISFSLGSDNDQACAGFLHIYEPSSATYVKHFYSRTMVSHGDDEAGDWYAAGYFNTTTALTRVQFKMSSGNIDSGTIKMYGVS